MIDFINETNYSIDILLFSYIAEYLTDNSMELVITDNNSIKELNREHRGANKPTDVLSFPLEQAPMMPLGSIVISLDYAKSGADNFKNSLNEELQLLFIHGLLHLLGFDHERDNGEMHHKEIEIIEYFNLPKSLIKRVQE